MKLLRVAVLTSARAPGLAHLLERDTLHGRAYRIVGVLASDPGCAERLLCERNGVTLAVHDLRAFAAAHGARWTDMRLREEYDAAALDRLAAWAPDAVVCLGYLRVLTPRFLAAFPRRVVNVHDADLAIRDDRGEPRYRGLRSTFDAIAAGEPETRCTVHVVTPALDQGPIVARSRAFPVHALVADARRWGATDILKAYAFAQREWMMRTAFGPLASHALVRMARSQAAMGGRGVELDEAAPAVVRRARVSA